MPQMSPLPWLTLMIMSFFFMLILMSYIYFFNQKNLKKNIFFMKNNYNLKW